MDGKSGRLMKAIPVTVLIAVVGSMVGMGLTMGSARGDGQAWPVSLGAGGSVMLIAPAALLILAIPAAVRVSRRWAPPLVVYTGLSCIAAGMAGNAAGSLVAQHRFWAGVAVDPWSHGPIGLLIGNPADLALVVGLCALGTAVALGISREMPVALRAWTVCLVSFVVIAIAIWAYAPLRAAEVAAWRV